MEQRYVGASGLRVSRLGLGTMTWGRDTDEHESREQLSAFLDAGGTLLDTAAGYGDGAAEELIGTLLREHVDRDDVVLLHQGRHLAAHRRPGRRHLAAGDARRPGRQPGPARRRPRGPVAGPHVERRGAAGGDAVGAGRGGDERAGALRRDLELRRLAERPGRDLAAAARARCRWWRPQVEYSLVNRDVEVEALPAAAAHGLGVFAWSPLGRGVLTGKYRHGTPADSRAASPHFAAFVERLPRPGSRQVVDALVTAAEGLDCSPAELALAWVRDQPGVVAPIVGARTAAQLRGHAGQRAGRGAGADPGRAGRGLARREPARPVAGPGWLAGGASSSYSSSSRPW